MIAGRVILLSPDQGLASIAGQAVGRGQPLSRFESPIDVPDWTRPPTRVVVLDFPKEARVVAYRQLRRRYLGPVLALLSPEEDASGLPTDHGRIDILHRPFTGEELSASLDALGGSRNGTRQSKSRSLTAPPVADETAAAPALDVSAVFSTTPATQRVAARRATVPTGGLTPVVQVRVAASMAASTDAAWAATGVPAAEVPVRRVTAGRRRALVWRRMGRTARRRMNGLALTLAAAAALVLGAMLGSGGGCGSAGCGSVAKAIENGAIGTRQASPLPGAQAAGGSGKGGSAKGAGSPLAPDPPEPSLVIPIASGVSDLISGTSSSSGGAPLLVVAPSTGSSTSGGTSGGGTTGGGTSSGGTSGGGLPSPTTQPTTTTSPVTTAPTATTSPPTTEPATTEPATTEPATTEPATTEPATTEPATTSPPTTEPATTLPPTTEPATTESPTTAATSSPTATETSPTDPPTTAATADTSAP